MRKFSEISEKDVLFCVSSACILTRAGIELWLAARSTSHLHNPHLPSPPLPPLHLHLLDSPYRALLHPLDNPPIPNGQHHMQFPTPKRDIPTSTNMQDTTTSSLLLE